MAGERATDEQETAPRSAGADGPATDAERRPAEAEQAGGAVAPQNAEGDQLPAGQPEPDTEPPPPAARDIPTDDTAHAAAAVLDGHTTADRVVTPALPELPFSRIELQRLDDALTEACRETGLHVSVYLGHLGPNPRAHAESLADELGERAVDAVLIAVSPGQRRVEVVTGRRARRYLPHRACQQVVSTMVDRFADGDLAGGLLAGVRRVTEEVTL